MQRYIKCTSCGSMEKEERAEFLCEDDYQNEENPVCWTCFAKSQDAKAEYESGGIFRNYEDWMEDKGATIAYAYEIQRREY